MNHCKIIPLQTGYSAANRLFCCKLFLCCNVFLLQNYSVETFCISKNLFFIRHTVTFLLLPKEGLEGEAD